MLSSLVVNHHFLTTKIEFARKNFSSFALFQLRRLFTLLTNFHVLSHVYAYLCQNTHLFRSHFVQMASNVALSIFCCFSKSAILHEIRKIPTAMMALFRYRWEFCCYFVVRKCLLSFFNSSVDGFLYSHLSSILGWFNLFIHLNPIHISATRIVLHRIRVPQQQLASSSFE